jgi:hypothetical protein
MKKTLGSLLFYFYLINLYGQTDSIPSIPIIINYTVLDTIEINLNSIKSEILWLNDTIKVTFQNEQIKIDTSLNYKLRKDLKDSTLMRTKEEVDDLIRLLKIGGQNCYSYALEKYFCYNEVFNQNIFSKSTRIDRESLEKILNNYFINIDEFSTRPKRNLKKTISNDVIIAFVNKSNWTIHLIYYCDDIFYTKNGVFKPNEFQSLKKFLKKHYWDTKKIIIYKIDEDKVKSICAKK